MHVLIALMQPKQNPLCDNAVDEYSQEVCPYLEYYHVSVPFLTGQGILSSCTHVIFKLL